MNCFSYDVLADNKTGIVFADTPDQDGLKILTNYGIAYVLARSIEANGWYILFIHINDDDISLVTSLMKKVKDVANEKYGNYDLPCKVLENFFERRKK